MWYEALSDSNMVFFTSLYSTIPELKEIYLTGLSIYDEGYRILLSFDMPVFADRPPKKWLARGNNTVFIELDFVKIEELTIAMESQEVLTSDIDIYKDDEGFTVVTITGAIQVSIKAKFGYIRVLEGRTKEVSTHGL